jgi:hypothetical protein
LQKEGEEKGRLKIIRNGKEKKERAQGESEEVLLLTRERLEK